MLAALLAGGTGRLGAQVVTMDEGSFTVTRAGARIGREEFRILRQPAAGGVAYVLRALGAYGDTRVSPALQTDSAGMPLRYQVEVRTGSTVELRIAGQLGGGRFTAQASTPTGEAAREYLVRDGTLILDQDVFHQYFALGLGRRADTATVVAVLSPRRNRQGGLRVQSRDAQTVTIGGAALEATHLVLTGDAGDRREVWLDRAGRVLRVLLPAEGLEALRDDPPR